MRTTTVHSLLGFGVSALVALLVAGCPPSYFQTCEGAECGSAEDDGGRDAPSNLLPKITSVTIPDNPSRMIRQGFGGTPTERATTVILTGEGLDSVTAVAVGTGPDALNGLMSSKKSTELVFTVLVRHGAPIGAHPVKVTSPSGTTTSSDVVSITGITASPSGSNSIDIGVDSSGTDVHPFRSLARATEFAVAGDTVSLKNGIYDLEHGETFATNGKNIPAGVTIRGESPGATQLIGPSLWGSCGAANTAFAPVGSARLENLVIRGFCSSGISTSTIGTLTLQSVNIRDVGSGVYANTEVVLDSVDISGSRAAVYANNAKVTILHSRIHHSETGVTVSGGTLTVTESEIDHNSNYSGDDRPGSVALVTAATTTTLTDVDIHHNDYAGLLVKPEASGPLSITRGAFWANQEAIHVSGPVKVKARESTFLESNKLQIYVDHFAAEMNFGMGGDAGNNEFKLCSTCDGIADARPATTAGLDPIWVSGNKWNSYPGPTQGCSDRESPAGRPQPPRHWTIENPGNCLSSRGNRFFN